MRFADPTHMHWLWLLPLCAGVLVMAWRLKRRRLHMFGGEKVQALSRSRGVLKAGMILLAVLFMVIGLARPRWGFQWKDLPTGGHDIVVVLDLSTSMLATDIKPNRLARAKWELMDLLKILEGDRMGLVAFAGVAFVHSPLTVDYRMAELFVRELDFQQMPVQGTRIGDGLQKALDTLEKAGQSDAQGKSIILITDGEDQESDPMKVAQLAKEKGIRIFPIGIGALEGAPIPLPEGGFKKDAQGQVVVSKLDEETLQQIASLTGGMYVRSTSGDLDLEVIYRKGIRAQDAEGEAKETRMKVWHERYQWFVLLALLLLVGEVLAGEYRRLAVLLCLAGFWGEKPLQANGRKGVQAYENQEYEKAAQHFLDAKISDPQNMIHSYNYGVSAFKNQQFDQAAQNFQDVAQGQNQDLAQKALYNLGNTLVAKGDLKGAQAAYEQVLKLNPEDQQAKENKAWVEKKLKEKPPSSDNKKQKESQDKQEQKQGSKDKQEQKKNSEDKQQQEQQKGSEDKQQQEQQKGSEDKQQDSEGKEKQGSAASGQELTKEQAERLLRTIEDREKTYGLPPKVQIPRHKPQKDW